MTRAAYATAFVDRIEMEMGKQQPGGGSVGRWRVRQENTDTGRESAPGLPGSQSVKGNVRLQEPEAKFLQALQAEKGSPAVLEGLRPGQRIP